MAQRRTEPARAVPKVDAGKVTPAPGPKASYIQLRVTPAERDEMHATAQRLGLGVSEYLRQLHRQAVESLERKGAR